MTANEIRLLSAAREVVSNRHLFDLRSMHAADAHNELRRAVEAYKAGGDQ